MSNATSQLKSSDRKRPWEDADAQAKERLSASEKFAMPRPWLGETVIYKPHPSDPQEVPATVISIGTRSLTVLVWIPGATYGDPKTGIRYISDPDSLNQSGDGVWTFSEQRDAFESLLKRVAELEAKGK